MILTLGLSKRYYREFITLGIILMLILAFGAVQQAKGEAITGERFLLSSSLPSTVSNHEYRFVLPAAWASGETLQIRLGGTFTTPVNDIADFDLSWDSTEQRLIVGAATAATYGLSISATEIDIVVAGDSVSIPSINDTVIIEVGTNATFDGVGNTQYTNPAGSGTPGVANIVSVDLNYNAAQDTGSALAAIIEGVTVSATVAETLSATIEGVAGGDCDTSFRVENDATATATSVSFGPINAATFYHGCQNLIVSTNAVSGYSATAEENTALYDTVSTNTIDNFAESSANPTTAGAWGTGNGFGFACVDINGGTRCTSAYTDANSLYRPFADISLSESIGTVISSGTATTSTSRIDYRIRIPGTQIAGAYSNIITYIFTPIF